MGKRISIIVTVLILFTLAGFSQVHAGGGPFNQLGFPGANSRSCGTWQASGLSGQASPGWFATYRLTDADGHLLAVGLIPRLPADGKVSGGFLRRPTRNPIQFSATAYYRGDVYSIGVVYANNPCIGPAASPTPIPITPSSTPFIPSPTPIPLSATPTFIAPNTTIVTCNFTLTEGYFTQSNAPFVRLRVNLASNLNIELGSAVAPVSNAYYAVSVSYPTQPEGTRLIISIGGWNGSQYVGPATIFGQDCAGTGGTPTFVPSVVPSATSTPSPSVNYHIEYFTADQTSIPAGGCVVLSYWVVGAQQITLYGSNWSGGPEIITDNPNQRTNCPSAAGNYVPGQPVVYTLNVTYLNGQTESRSITIQVGLPATPTLVPTVDSTNTPLPTFAPRS